MLDLTIVIPCYNEESVVEEAAARLLALLDEMTEQGKVEPSSGLYFVDDGSDDETWSIVKRLSASEARVRGLKLSRNRGHQNALLAGLLYAPGDALVSIDADLQDDIRVIENMVDAYASGKDIVYGVRAKRDTDATFKRLTAEGFYHLLRFMGVDVVFNHADFRLMSRRALTALREFSEVNLFLRGIVPSIGFPSAIVTYDRSKRFAGESKYPLRKMLSLAIHGVTSFSEVPLRMVAVAGLVVFVASLVTSAWALWVALFSEKAVPGWASSVLPIYMLGGIQLLSIGILGEYIGKIYLESKRRPRFIVEELLGDDLGKGVSKSVGAGSPEER